VVPVDRKKQKKGGGGDRIGKKNMKRRRVLREACKNLTKGRKSNWKQKREMEGGGGEAGHEQGEQSREVRRHAEDETD